MKLLFATSNLHKFKEVQRSIPAIEWLSLHDFPILKDLNPEETGVTLEENAIIKAKAYAQASGVATVAEDTGLMVDALHGEPGVYSARWVAGSDKKRYTALLNRLEKTEDRAARYMTVACYFNPATQKMKLFEGALEGVIGWEAKGSHGFGYDPVFIPQGFTQTFGEIGPEVKKTISHRARAFEKLSTWLQDDI